MEFRGHSECGPAVAVGALPAIASKESRMEWLSWFTRPKAKAASSERPRRPVQSGKYAGAEIIPSRHGSCKAVQSLAGKRFLAAEVPLFPLRDCDQPKCECTYRRYADRRTTIRRSADLGVGASGPMLQRGSDRRRADVPGRRATDLHPE